MLMDSIRYEDKEAPPGRPTLWNTILATLLLWIWMLPSAVFWWMSIDNGIVLPGIPYAVWFLPGQLWRISPVAHIISVIALPAFFYWFCRSRNCFNAKAKTMLCTAMLLIIFVHLMWGLSVVRATA